MQATSIHNKLVTAVYTSYVYVGRALNAISVLFPTHTHSFPPRIKEMDCFIVSSGLIYKYVIYAVTLVDADPEKSEDSNTSSPPTVPRRSLCLDPSDSPDRLTERPCKLMMARNLQLTTRGLAAVFCRMLPAALLVILLKQWDTHARKSLWRAGGHRSNAVMRQVRQASGTCQQSACSRPVRENVTFCLFILCLGVGDPPFHPDPTLAAAPSAQSTIGDALWRWNEGCHQSRQCLVPLWQTHGTAVSAAGRFVCSATGPRACKWVSRWELFTRVK